MYNEQPKLLARSLIDTQAYRETLYKKQGGHIDHPVQK